MHFLEYAAEHGRLDAPLQEVERLNEWHAGFEERRQLLVEHQKLARVERVALRQAERHARDRALRVQRQNVEALLIQFMAQPRFVLGRVDAFDDLAVGRREPAAEFHAQASPPQLIVGMDITGMWDYIKLSVASSAARNPPCPKAFRARVGEFPACRDVRACSRVKAGWILRDSTGRSFRSVWRSPEELQDARHVVARFGIRRYTAEAPHRRLAGIVSRQRER